MDDLICIITAISLATIDAGEASSRIAHLVDLFLDGMLKLKEKR